MQEREPNKPVKLNLDVSKKYLSPDSAYYLLNHERNITGKGTIGKFTPMPSNYKACDMEPMAGVPYSVGSYRDPITNEVYSWNYNNGGINYILRLNGDGSCQVIYNGGNECLPLSADPEHSIEQWRAYLKIDKLCAHRHGKALVWTNGLHEIGMIDVEASIITDSFTTDFFDRCPDPCAYTEMCVPLSCTQLVGEFIPLDPADVHLNNKLLDVAFQVCYRFVYYDERVSEWMGVSSTYYQDSKSCFDNSEGYSRCIKFRMPIGNPMVDRIEVAVRRDNELFTDGLSPLWRFVERIEKYKPYSSQSQMWYERDLADLLNFSEEDCSFDYIFCNDKECNPLDTTETNRIYNPLPIQPQGIIRVKDSIGFYNYKKGNCPIDGTQTNKFQISLNCQPDNCNENFATVKIKSIIHHSNLHINGFVYRLGGNSINAVDDPTDVARFGTALLPPDGYGQFFKDKTRNFIAYVEGTDYWAEMKQYHSSAYLTNTVLSGIVSGMSNFDIKQQVYADIYNGNFYYQEYEIKVPKGTKGFIRIASHQVTDGLPGSGQDKSTFVIGSVADIHGYRGNIDLSGVIQTYKKELYFDTCAGDVTLNETLIIDDNYTPFESGAHTSSAYSGYLTDANNKPVEGAEISYEGTARAITDHNGFYSFYLYGNENIQTITVQIRVETNCVNGFHDTKSVTLSGGYGQLVQSNIQITDIDFPTYKSNFYETVNIQVKDCANVPIGGIRVALSGSKYRVTDSVTGVASFRVRNYSTRARAVRGVVMDVNNCFTLDCSNGCNPCLPSTNNTVLSACFSGTPYTYIALTSSLNRNPALVAKNGLKAGGRYPFGIVVKWPCNKVSAVYPVSILNGSIKMPDNYLDIPKTQDKGVVNFCNIHFNGNGITLPIGANCLSIVRGENINRFELQWTIDKIERTLDNKIKLTIQSLNDYNASFNFETNTVYQYQKNDRVEFISNGDGTIFDSATYGILNYQILSPFHDKIISGQTNAPADYFNQILINDDGKLDGLTIGAKIEFQRPAQCTVEPTYYEVLSLPIDEDGHLVTPTGTFNTFDTFLVNRKINNGIYQLFEHHSPSDHWGSRINDGGKVHFVDPFENERRFGRNISFNSPTHFNIFGYIEKTLDAPEQGDITAMGIYDGKIGIGIAEHDNFRFQVADDFLRVGSDGIVRAAAPDQIISDTEPKVSGAFGCQYPHIGSIYFGDGFVMYWDVNKSAYVKHDFNIARDISIGKAKMYFQQRGQFIESFNDTVSIGIQQFRIITGFNFSTGAVQLTVKALNQGGTNNTKAAVEQTNDTILFHPETEDFLTFAGYTPERYSNLDLNDEFGCAFVAFLNGIPYIHPKIALSDNDYNEFFGVPTDWIAAISLNEAPEKIKIPISAEVQSEDLWFIHKVTTDKPGFESEIPPIRWKKKERKSNASFLFDKNSRGGLYGTNKRTAGTQARGYYIACVFIRDNTDALKYDTVNPAKMTKFGELDMIIFKQEFSEQSGYTGNL